MATSVEDARKTAEKFVEEFRPGCQVAGLLEDEQDYFIRLELVPPQEVWPDTGSFAFVSKATGKLWQGAAGEVLDKIDNMKAT